MKFHPCLRYGAAAVWLLAACARVPKDEEPREADREPAPPESRDVLDESERALAESEAVYRRALVQARALRDAGRTMDALLAVEHALSLRPSSPEAMRLRSELLRLMGRRDVEAGEVLEDLLAERRARLEAQKVEVRRLLDEAARARREGRPDDARLAYERAAFIVEAARYAPVEGDRGLEQLGDEAEAGLRELEAEAAARQRAREEAATEEALREMSARQARALETERRRRAELLVAAIDRFNREEFAAAEHYAEQVLETEPDNAVALDIVHNARRAQYIGMQADLLREMKRSFTTWRVDIERTLVPESDILVWPSQAYWDHISRVRAARAVVSTESGVTEEERRLAEELATRRVELSFDGVAFPQVRNYLVAASGLNIVIDPRALEDVEAAEVTVEARDVVLKDALDLVLQQVSPEGEVVYEVTGNVVRFIRKEHQRLPMTLRIHPVADLTLGLTDFIPPEITKLGVGDDFDTPLFGAEGEEKPTLYGTADELAELVRTSVAPESWEGTATIGVQGKNIVTYNTPQVQEQVTRFLDDLRAFSGIIVTVEGSILRISEGALRDIGVDFRGLGGSNQGPLAPLDDVTSGLENNASAGLDNSGPGLEGGAAAQAPSSGLFFDDGQDGDFRGRSENMLVQPIGRLLSATGGGTFQATYLDDFAVSAILRATEKSLGVRRLSSPSLSVFNTQRAHLAVVRQVSFIQEFDVEVAQTSFIADPVIGVIQDGVVLDVRPVVSSDRRTITMNVRSTMTSLLTPIATFTTLLGGAVGNPPGVRLRNLVPRSEPVTIQLPQIDVQATESTIRIPDGGSLLLSGLRTIRVHEGEATTPILGRVPVLSFLFSRKAKSEEVEDLMVVVRATITDLQAQADTLRLAMAR